MDDFEESFTGLVRRVRSGDPEAAAELVRQFEPEVRIRVRTWLRLRGGEFRRTFDSMDVCQSVLANFFVRASAGQYELAAPDNLMGLLAVMARNKLCEYVKRQQAERRDVRRTSEIGSESMLPADQVTPSRIVAGRELLAEFRSRLSEEERGIGDLRMADCGWAQVAAELGGSAEGRRKQWARAVDRVARELGLDDEAGVSFS
jgi:DNA-directed RNA polymerase specialized sigma24 family protein